MTPPCPDFDSYLAAQAPEKRAALEALRQAIHAAAPGLVECIAYRLPAFRLDGRLLVAIGAAARHCALYPMSATTIAAHADALAAWDTSKGTIRFAPARPLPAALVQHLIAARVAEHRELAAQATKQRADRPSRPRRSTAE